VRTYKFIHFDEIPQRHSGKFAWGCYNNESDEMLGVVRWYPRWRQYCYFQTVQAVYSASCLADIQDFIGGIGTVTVGKETKTSAAADAGGDVA